MNINDYNSIAEWRQAVYDRPWTPTREIPLDERLIAYIGSLEKELAELREFRFNEMWRRDQASEHRMGL